MNNGKRNRSNSLEYANTQLDTREADNGDVDPLISENIDMLLEELEDDLYTLDVKNSQDLYEAIERDDNDTVKQILARDPFAFKINTNLPSPLAALFQKKNLELAYFLSQTDETRDLINNYYTNQVEREEGVDNIFFFNKRENPSHWIGSEQLRQSAYLFAKEIQSRDWIKNRHAIDAAPEKLFDNIVLFQEWGNPLHWAVETQDIKLVMYFCDVHPDFMFQLARDNKSKDFFKRPLHLAIEMAMQTKNFAMVDLLISKGALNKADHGTFCNIPDPSSLHTRNTQVIHELKFAAEVLHSYELTELLSLLEQWRKSIGLYTNSMFIYDWKQILVPVMNQLLYGQSVRYGIADGSYDGSIGYTEDEVNHFLISEIRGIFCKQKKVNQIVEKFIEFGLDNCHELAFAAVHYNNIELIHLLIKKNINIWMPVTKTNYIIYEARDPDYFTDKLDMIDESIDLVAYAIGCRHGKMAHRLLAISTGHIDLNKKNSDGEPYYLSLVMTCFFNWKNIDQYSGSCHWDVVEFLLEKQGPEIINGLSEQNKAAFLLMAVMVGTFKWIRFMATHHRNTLNYCVDAQQSLLCFFINWATTNPLPNGDEAEGFVSILKFVVYLAQKNALWLFPLTTDTVRYLSHSFDFLIALWINRGVVGRVIN